MKCYLILLLLNSKLEDIYSYSDVNLVLREWDGGIVKSITTERCLLPPNLRCLSKGTPVSPAYFIESDSITQTRMINFFKFIVSINLKCSIYLKVNTDIRTNGDVCYSLINDLSNYPYNVNFFES